MKSFLEVHRLLTLEYNFLIFQSVDKNEQKKFLIERIRAASRQTLSSVLHVLN